jgi:hypothetical protein
MGLLKKSASDKIEEKRKLVNQGIGRELEFLDNDDIINEDDKVRPEKILEGRKLIEGYEAAPQRYQLARLLIYQESKKQEWDDAEIEKILDQEVKVMLKDGRINEEEYTNIREMNYRETSKKLQT